MSDIQKKIIELYICAYNLGHFPLLRLKGQSVVKFDSDKITKIQDRS